MIANLQKTWSTATRAVRTSKKFVYALLALHNGYPDLMSRGPILMKIMSKGPILLIWMLAQKNHSRFHSVKFLISPFFNFSPSKENLMLFMWFLSPIFFYWIGPQGAFRGPPGVPGKPLQALRVAATRFLRALPPRAEEAHWAEHAAFHSGTLTTLCDLFDPIGMFHKICFFFKLQMNFIKGPYSKFPHIIFGEKFIVEVLYANLIL